MQPNVTDLHCFTAAQKCEITTAHKKLCGMSAQAGQGEQDCAEMEESCEMTGDDQMSESLGQEAGSLQADGSNGADTGEDNEEMEDQCQSVANQSGHAAQSDKVVDALLPAVTQVSWVEFNQGLHLKRSKGSIWQKLSLR